MFMYCRIGIEVLGRILVGTIYIYETEYFICCYQEGTPTSNRLLHVHCFNGDG